MNRHGNRLLVGLLSAAALFTCTSCGTALKTKAARAGGTTTTVTTTVVTTPGGTTTTVTTTTGPTPGGTTTTTGMPPGTPPPHIKILSQPADQLVHQSNTVTLMVVADVVPPWADQQISYQWEVNKTQYVLANKALYFNDVVAATNILGATNSILTITNVQLSDVGFYRVRMTAGALTAVSEAAALQVWYNGSIIVVGTPTVSGGNSSPCPGAYNGYVTYKNTGAWGWAPDNSNSHTATDGNSGPTEVQLGGSSGDKYCSLSQTSSITTSPPTSAQYRVTVYFPGAVPSGNYSITLNGFQ